MAKQRKQRKSAYIPPAHEVVNRKERRASGPRKSRPATDAKGRRVIVPEPPSWRRALRQAPLYGLLMVLVEYVFGKGEANARLAAAVAFAIPAMLVMIPFIYWIDRTKWRRYQQMQDASKGKQ